MRQILGAAIGLLLVGCGPSRQELFLDAHDTCMNYGMRTGTPEYAQCMMQKDQQYADQAARRQANIQQGLQGMRIPEPQRGTTCRTGRDGYGNLITQCQ